MFRQKYFLLLFFCFLAGLALAQQGNNPFEVTGAQSDSSLLSADQTNPFDLDHRSLTRRNNYNPFDVSRNEQRNLNRLEDISASPIITKPKDDKLSNFNFILYSSILILFTFLFTLYRNLLLQIYKSLLNENILKLLHREQIGIVKTPYFIWYLFFIISISAFILHLIYSFNPSIPINLWLRFGQICLAILVLIVLKHLGLIVLGSVFPLKKELGLYSFTFILFNIIMGLALVPINLLIAFGPLAGYKTFIFIGLGLIALLVIIGTLRVLGLTGSKWGQYPFHFFIYLCAFEIAPVIVLVKLIIS